MELKIRIHVGGHFLEPQRNITLELDLELEVKPLADPYPALGVALRVFI